MKTFIEYMNEIEKKRLSIEWNSSKLIGKFDNHGVLYMIEFIEHKSDVYSVKFYRFDDDKWSPYMFNDNHYIGNLYVTITETIIDFIRDRSLPIIIFQAVKSDKGRIRMYDKFSSRLSKMFDYNVKNINTKLKTYCLHRYSNEDDLINALSGIKISQLNRDSML